MHCFRLCKKPSEVGRVSHVREEGSYQIPRPDSPITSVEDFKSQEASAALERRPPALCGVSYNC